VEQNAAEGEARTAFCGTQKCRTGIFALIVCYAMEKPLRSTCQGWQVALF